MLSEKIALEYRSSNINVVVLNRMVQSLHIHKIILIIFKTQTDACLIVNFTK